MNAPAGVSHSVRTMFIRSSILRTMEDRLELRLCSILIPVKKVRTNSARESAFTFGRSTSIFLAMSCFSLPLLRVMMPTTSLVSLQVAWSQLEKSLDVIPAQGFGGQQFLLLETFKVVLKALREQILFILELG